MRIIAGQTDYRTLCERIRSSPDQEIIVDECLGQRYIGCGLSGKSIVINGTPGNALGAYMDGCAVTVMGNAQDAVGDTMDDGSIVIHGSVGDAVGYSMRGGMILVERDAGYRAGIHMKSYREKQPLLVIGGRPGSFLGEYQAGGVIVVLQRFGGAENFVCNFCGNGMHGGKIFVRSDTRPVGPPPNISVAEATAADKAELSAYVEPYCKAFGADREEILSHRFYVMTPDSKNPYRQLYTHK
jgi:hypothetical protein